jgi:hypothetical protein
MASEYVYTITLFDADRRKQGPKFEGVVSSTLKPLESQVSKDEIFVTTFYTARDYTDQFGNLNFIINKEKTKEKEKKEKAAAEASQSAPRAAATVGTAAEPVPGPSSTPA